MVEGSGESRDSLHGRPFVGSSFLNVRHYRQPDLGHESLDKLLALFFRTLQQAISSVAGFDLL